MSRRILFSLLTLFICACLVLSLAAIVGVVIFARF
jgi:hypothetical protein